MLYDHKIDWKSLIKNFNDFPKKGVIFRDINPLFRNSDAIQEIAKQFIHQEEVSKIDYIAGIESRGFTVASLLAKNFNKGIILVRKVGKLPGKTMKKKYNIEYGSSVIEIQDEAIQKGQNILIADDLIATGGTAIATAELIEEMGGRVFGFAVIIELVYLKGAEILRNRGYDVRSLVKYYD
ncbi:MAG TPA: adenine phosphoribosyltransferase [Nitrososphaeraceae archaeon]|nr:adenine phosphoribosyltransferase [Nitrososphaeraceae archaeon]